MYKNRFTILVHNFSCHFFSPGRRNRCLNRVVHISRHEYVRRRGEGRGGEGKNKNRRPIESGAINGSRHCSPRFQVKFARIKNGAIVYRNSLFVFFFSRSTRYIRKIVSAFLLIDIQSPFLSR